MPPPTSSELRLTPPPLHAPSATPPQVFKVRRTWFAMVAETDFLMGQVLEAARARADYANTLVVFLSDHGEMNMAHRQVWKNSFYEGSLRVPLIVSGGAVAGAALPRGTTVTNITSLLDVYPTLLDWAGVAQPPDGQLSGSSLAPFLAGADAWARGGSIGTSDGVVAARKPYAVAEYFSNMGNTGAFCVVEGRYKYMTFGTGFNATFGSYAPQLFDVVNDPNELTNLATTMPEVVARLDATLRAELASGVNALSPTGDYQMIDRHVKRQQQQLYRRFFVDEAHLAAQFERLRACEAALAAASADGPAALAWRLAVEPDYEYVCGANREPLGPDDGSSPSKKLRALFRKAYTGFDDNDWAKVQQWIAQAP